MMFELTLKEKGYLTMSFRFSDKNALSQFMFEALESHSVNDDGDEISVELKKCAGSGNSEMAHNELNQL